MNGELLLPHQVFGIDQALINRYADLSGDHNPLHLDPGFAAATVFEGTIAHGMMTLAFISETLSLWSGETWGKACAIDVTFLAPARPGDEIIVSGSRTSDENGEVVIRFECRVDRGSIAVGEARTGCTLGQNRA